MNNLLKGRNFQFWEYKVSHGSLLIRSPKNSNLINNIDIIFFGVEFISLPRHMSNLSIEIVNNLEIESLGLIRGKKPSKENVFVLQDSEKRYLIVASGINVESNELDIFDSPFSI